MTRRTDGQSAMSSGMNGSASGAWKQNQALRRVLLAAITAGMVLAPPVATAQDQPAAGPGPYVVPESGGATLEVRPSDAPRRVVITAGSSRVVEVDQPLKRVSVVTPEVADVALLSPRQVAITARSVGNTQVILWDDQDHQMVFDVVVEMDLSQLKRAIAMTAPRARVEVMALRDAVLLMGQVPDTDSAKRIEELAGIFTQRVQNQMTVVGETQVLLRCTVAEVSKSAIRRLGINGWLAGDNIRDVFAINQIDGINPSNIGAAPTGNIIDPKVGTGGFPPQSILFGTPNTSPGIPLLPPPQGPEFSLGFPRVQMQLFFKALRENGLLKVLAEPNLVAMSGQEATFLAGGEFPVPVPQSLGTTTIEWREFGVRLRFTPTVIGGQMIRLQVTPEVSERDFTTAVTLAGATTVPGLKSRSASTTVELASGSTISIAGLLSEQVQASAGKIPGLGDVPMLGALFSSVEYQKNMTELVILVTPELVSYMTPDQVSPVPGQHLTEPDDLQLFGFGQIEGEPLVDDNSPEKALRTAVPPSYQKITAPPEQMALQGPWGPAEEPESSK